MNHMRLVAAHFSPTGTTVKIIRSIAEGFACPAREIDLSAPVSPVELQKDELLLVAVPVFSGRVPSVALDRLEQISDGTNKAIAVVVYGNRAFDDALLELKDALERKGFQVIAAAAFVAEHSMARSIAAGRPNAQDLAQASSFGSAVMKKLSSGVVSPVVVPGDPGYKDKQLGSSSSHPITTETCIGCGACARACPMGAITLTPKSQTRDDICINCVRCIALCPQSARLLPGEMADRIEAMLQKVASVPKQPEMFF